MIPYGRQSIEQDDIDAVIKVLTSDFLTQGESVGEFEKKLAEYCGAKCAGVVSSGTAALHAAFFAIGLAEGDEFITSSMTFAATANAGLWQKGKPVFVDIDLETGNIDVEKIEEKITDKTKAIVPVDYTGRPADLEKIKQIADKHNLVVVEDACQALGAVYHGRKIGAISDLTVFSFHPVKSITTGEGGAILTNNGQYYKKMKSFITHGVTKGDFIGKVGGWQYDMVDLGLNYRLTDIACALGISQLKKIDTFLNKRIELVKIYNIAFENFTKIIIPKFDDKNNKSGWHLYVIRLNENNKKSRKQVFDELRDIGIGVQVHHTPVHTLTYYKNLGYTGAGLENTEKFYNSILSLPLYPNLTKEDQNKVIEKVKEIIV